MPKRKITVGTPIQALVTQTDKQQAIQLVTQTLQKKYGHDVLMRVADMDALERQTTGLEELDNILGGGVPVGRIIEVFGKEQSGKTAIACQLASQVSTCVFIDAEKKMTSEMAAILHLPADTIRVRPHSLEDAFEMVRDYANVGTEMIILDSLPALFTEKEAEEKDYSKRTGMAAVAGFLSLKLQIIMDILDTHKSTLVVVNQLRANINAVPFGEQYHTFGGHALPNYASIRLSTARMKWLKDDPKKPVLGVYGAEIAVLTHKSNVSKPQKGTSLPNIYDYGLVANEHHAQIKADLIAEYKRLGKEPREQPEVASSDVSFDKVSITEELNEMAGE